MKLLAVAVAALALAGQAAAASEAPSLEPAASWVAGKPVTVTCDPRLSGGFTDVFGVGAVRLGSDVCAALRARLAGRGEPAHDAAALRVLAHESEHAKGIRNESEADCAALRYLPGMASRFFGYRTWRSRHDLMALAWESHRLLPAEYQTLC